MIEPVTDGNNRSIAARYSGLVARILIPLALIVAVLVWVVGRWDDPPAPLNDPAIRNITVLICAFLAGLTAWLWFCFGSNFSRRLRLGVALSSALAMLLLVGTIATLRLKRVIHFSGSLVPRLVKRERDPTQFNDEPSAARASFHSTSEEDFPQFLGRDRSGWLAGPALARDWEENPPRLLWKRPIGAGWSAFATTNGFAVTLEQRGDEEWVACYEMESGKPVWGHAIKARHETALGGVGPRSTPTIYEGQVFALGATGVLRCLDEGGQLLWSDDLRKRYQLTDDEDEENVMFGRSASPLIVDSLVIVPGGGPQKKAKNLIAFDRQTGRLVWEAKNELPNGDADQIAYASPALSKLAGRQQILIVNESTASGHDPATGQRLWSHSWPGRSNGNASTSQAIGVGDNRVLLTKGYGGGAELIELVEAHGDQLTTKSVWKVSRVLQTKFSNVVLQNQHAFALSEGILECVGLDNGKRRWKSGRYGHGQILGVGQLLLVLSEDGELHLLELNAEKFVHLGSVEALNGKSWNNLCLSGKRLLVRNAEEAACYELP